MSSFTEDLEYEFTGSYWNKNPIYVVTKEFSYRFGDFEQPLYVFTVPVGYESDFASIPWPVSLFLKPNGPWAKAALIHDLLYTDFPEVSRVVADSVFLEGMLILEVNPLIAHLFHAFVRIYQMLTHKGI